MGTLVVKRLILFEYFLIILSLIVMKVNVIVLFIARRIVSVKYVSIK